MIAKPFDAIIADDIKKLVEGHEQEGRALEFKRELPGPKDSDRKEFLADVSSFANAIGGDILYGVIEEDGRAEAAPGISVLNPEAEVLRLDNMIRDGIRPRIIGSRVRAIPGFSSGPVFLIRVPRSLAGPHIISYQQDFRFYSRTPAGKFRMDVSDIRDAILNSTTVGERTRALRSERVGRIVAGETPVRLTGNRLVCVHVFPHASLVMGEHVDLTVAMKQSLALSPFHRTAHYGPRFNLDGIYTWAADGNESRNAYLQVFRTGVLESVDASLLSDMPANIPAGLPSGAFANALFRFVANSIAVYSALGVGFPLTIFVSLASVNELVLYVSRNRQAYLSRLSFDRGVVLLPELVLDETPDNVRSAVRPLLDALWQAAGAERCFDFDESGAWNPQ